MAREKRIETTDARTQSERFIETARAIGADEDEATFKAKLGVIARQKPKDEPKKQKSQDKSRG